MIERRALGETDLSVTRIGLGVATLGRPGCNHLGRDEDLVDHHRGLVADPDARLLGGS